MDPISIMSLAGAVVGVIDVITRRVDSLLKLQTGYKTANLKVSLLVGQLSTLKAALSQIREWIDTSLINRPQHQQLVADLKVSIEGCKLLISVLDDHFQCFEEKETSTLGTMRKIHFLWEQGGINDYLNHLNNQINALNLLLTALQCRSLFEQRDLLQSDESRFVFKRIIDDRSSLLWLHDTDSCLSRKSTTTGASDMIDAIFDFDQEIFTSKAYRVAARSNMKQALLNKRNNVRKRESLTTRSVEVVGRNPPLDEHSQILRGIDENPGPLLDMLQTRTNVASAVAGLEQTPSNHEVRQGHVKINQSTSVAYEPIPVNVTPSNSTSGFVGLPADAKRKVNLKSMTFRKWIWPETSSSHLSQRLIKSPVKLGRIEETPENGNRLATTKAKVLILGSSKAGKSTLVESMRLWERTYSSCERESAKEIIFSILVTTMRGILEEMDSRGMSLETDANQFHIAIISRQPDFMAFDALPPQVTSAIAALWRDSGVRRCFQMSNGYHLNESCQYYYESIDRIGQRSYVPTDQDIVRSRVRTTGIVSHPFIVGDSHYEIYDVGGSRSERKKWIHCFEGVDIVLFVIDISAYDKRLYEDRTTNSVDESVLLFDGVCNSRYFNKTGMILCFNKVDLLEQKLGMIPVKEYCRDYDGSPTDLAAIKLYFRDKFLGLDKQSDRSIDVLWASATDGVTVAKTAFDIIKNSVDRRNHRTAVTVLNKE